MDQKQRKQINEAAEKFAEAIRDPYSAASNRAVSAQELNAELTQDFFSRPYGVLLSAKENQVQQVPRAFVDEPVIASAVRYREGNLAHRESFRFTRYPDSHQVDRVESIDKAGRAS